MSVFKIRNIIIGAAMATAMPGAAQAAALCTNGGFGPGDYSCQYDGLAGNTNDNAVNVGAAIFAATGEVVTLTQYGKSDDDGALFTFTNATFDAGSGEWEFSSNSTDFSIIDAALKATYITVKAANDFILFHYENGANLGSLTSDILNGGRNIADISHVTFWNVQSGPLQNIPSPGALSLLLLGVGGLLGARRIAR